MSSVTRPSCIPSSTPLLTVPSRAQQAWERGQSLVLQRYHERCRPYDMIAAGVESVLEMRGRAVPSVALCARWEAIFGAAPSNAIPGVVFCEMERYLTREIDTYYRSVSPLVSKLHEIGDSGVEAHDLKRWVAWRITTRSIGFWQALADEAHYQCERLLAHSDALKDALAYTHEQLYLDAAESRFDEMLRDLTLLCPYSTVVPHLHDYLYACRSTIERHQANAQTRIRESEYENQILTELRHHLQSLPKAVHASSDPAPEGNLAPIRASLATLASRGWTIPTLP